MPRRFPMANFTRTADLPVIDLEYVFPAKASVVAGLTHFGGHQMIGRFAHCRDVIMATHTSSQNLIMIHLNDRFPGICVD